MAAWPLVARAQQAGKLPTIGFVGAGTPSTYAPWVAAFVQRLRELGWVEDRTVAIEIRWAEGRGARYAEIAAEFVQLKVDAILTIGTPATLAAKQATSVVPIVFVAVNDPVELGVVANLARPGGNVTGLSNQQHDVAGKRLELLREVVPGLRRLAILANPANAGGALEMKGVETLAGTIGLQTVTLQIRQAEEIGPALETLPPRKKDDALLRGLKRVKVDATWVPWTASRLTYVSGYGAGVESPAWYRHLWETNGDLTTWLASAARLLRAEDLDASPAQAVDAVRLAEALSALRGRPQPSLSDVTDATLTVLCGGESARMGLIERRLIVGEEMGSLPEGVPAVPLQRDIEAQARRLRLR